MLPIFTRDDGGLTIAQFSRKPEKMSVNHELTIASFLVNKLHTYGDFLFVNAPLLHASVEATHFRKALLTWIFRFRPAEV
jgi:hypothetical protein